MSVSLVAASNAVNNGATGTAVATATPTLPTGTVSGNRVFISGCATAAPTLPANWTQLHNAAIGSGSFGVSTGPRHVFVFYRDYDGVWTMPAISTASHAAPSLVVSACSFTKTAAAWSTPLVSVGTDASLDTSLSVTGSTSWSVVNGMVVYAVVGFPGNPGAVGTASLNPAGATTKGGEAIAPGVAGTATGNDAYAVWRYVRPAANGSGTPSFTSTLGTARTSGGVFIYQEDNAGVSNLDKLRIGNSIPAAIRLGTGTVSAVYQGTNKVWP